MLHANTQKELQSAVRVAKRYLNAHKGLFKASHVYELAARMMGYPNHMANRSQLERKDHLLLESQKKAAPDRIFERFQSPYTSSDLKAMKGVIDCVVPANPYNLGDTEMLEEEVSEMITGNGYELHAIQWEVYPYFYDVHHVAIRVTAVAMIEDDGDDGDEDDANSDTPAEGFAQFISLEGWGHIFIGNTETITRWVVDPAAKTLVFAQYLVSGLASTWTDMDKAMLVDLAESLYDNDVLSPGAFDTEPMPNWASRRYEVPLKKQ